jgi:acyl carrier protein
MDQRAIVQLIVEVVEGYRLSMQGARENLTPESRLFGPSGLLDSLGLVSVLVELEQRASDAFGRPVSIMDDRAMSQTSSPFRTIRSLADYLGQQIERGSSA